MPAPNEITPAQLLRLIGLPDAPMIVDLCLPEDFAQDPVVIPTAHRHSHTDLPGLAALLHDRPGVIVCQKGAKLSQGAAAWLRAEGLRAEYLAGGMMAWRAHKDAPATDWSALPDRRDGATLWVTRHRPRIDRIACPWLLRRFVDPAARILYVTPGEVAAVAERLGATAFDAPGAALGHDGAHCTFDAILDRFGLRTEPLARMARIIRAADTNRPDLAPQAAGLLALSVGLSRQYRDDNRQLDAALPLYDALYRWARDGADETHDSGAQGGGS